MLKACKNRSVPRRRRLCTAIINKVSSVNMDHAYVVPVQASRPQGTVSSRDRVPGITITYDVLKRETTRPGALTSP
jgi:hypothetical protein